MTLPTSAVLAVDKPSGPTSHDVVARVRRALGTRRVGHTGTLDPFASGLLLICIGVATRLSEYLTGLPKTYVGLARFGSTTTTDDLAGDIVSESDAWQELDRASVETLLGEFVGRSDQRPPPFSAKKVDGERAYRRARRGEDVVLAPVEIEIQSLELLDWSPPEARFRVVCSSGTYIRALARDLGERTGAGAHLRALRREAIGTFTTDSAVPGDSLEPGVAPARGWISPVDAVAHLSRLDVGEGEIEELRQGRRIPSPREDLDEGEVVALVASGALVAIGESVGGSIQPRKVLL